MPLQTRSGDILAVELARHNLLHHLTVVSGSKIRSKVAQLRALLGLDLVSSNVDHSASVGAPPSQLQKSIVCISASLPASTKLVSVVEITKRHARDVAAAAPTPATRPVLYQYTCVHEAAPSPSQTKASIPRLAQPQNTAPKTSSATENSVADNAGDSEDFESLRLHSVKNTPQRADLVTTIYLSKESIKLLKEAYGEQTVV